MDEATKNEVNHDEVVWRPSETYLKRSRLRRFMADVGVDDIETLRGHAAKDPGWYWDAVARDLGLVWSRPYDSVLDVSAGAPWPEWFPGAGFNYVASALDSREKGEQGAEPALLWEGDDGAQAALTYPELVVEVNKAANALRTLGIGPGDRVGIFLPMLLETAIATLACGKIGALFVP
ncbi:MAG: AMP-binding protein, partial [Chloroflexota bacterium]|nr:AMP-binding protein [Chloroflexota bacterium]